MRDPARIGPMMAALHELWAEFPDYRLGQLIMNLCRPLDDDDRFMEIVGFLDPWEWEEDEWLRRIAAYRRQFGKE